MEFSQAPSPALPTPEQQREIMRKLYLAIGELYVSRGELFNEYQMAMKQIEEMSNVITRLRAERDNGKLVKSPDNHEL